MMREFSPLALLISVVGEEIVTMVFGTEGIARTDCRRLGILNEEVARLELWGKEFRLN